MSNLLEHFRKEVEILHKKYPGEGLVIDPYIKELEALIEVFANEGHSGASAGFCGPIIADTIKKALAFEPLSGLTGEDEEWVEVGMEYGSPEPCYQNKRNSAVFKDSKEGKPYYLDGLIWKEEGHGCWGGTAEIESGKILKSSVTIKDLDKFRSQRFYIDVKNISTIPEDCVFQILNPEQLKAAEEIYEFRYAER